MNKEVAIRRYMNVMRPDVMHSSQGDFLATHVPMKKLYVTSHLTENADVPEEDKKHPKTEEEVYSEFMSESEDDQFVLVVGDSGAGKSHLIRWIKTMYELKKSDNEIVLPIRRAHNNLKGTIQQLIELPEVKNIPNQELYKKIVSAATTVPKDELKNSIYYSFIVLLENDKEGKAGDEDGERRIGKVDRTHLIELLKNALFKNKLMEDEGPIDSIYKKIAGTRSTDENDKIPEFTLEDFEIDSSLFNVLIKEADSQAIKIINKMSGNPEFINKIREYMNLFIEKVIQRCAGLEPGDLAEVIREIRQELYKQGKSLTILIEDITAASGVDDSLLDALLTDKIAYPGEKLCRLNSIVGSTDGYYREKFKTNTKGRIRKFVYVPDDLFHGNMNGLLEFFAKYINTISLEEREIQDWLENDNASAETYPIHEATCGKGWGEYNYNGHKINLYPFTPHAIKYLYENQDVTRRNPRALMSDIIETYIKDSLDNPSIFPTKRPTLKVQNMELQNTINNLKNVDDSTKIRLRHFMYVWGTGKLEKYSKDGIQYIAGIPSYVYEDLQLPVLDGKEIEPPSVQEVIIDEPIKPVPSTEHKDLSNAQKENEQIMIALSEVDKWIEQKDYKLNVGASTKNVRALNETRKNINDFLYNTIDWVSEGVSVDAVLKIKNASNKYLVAFERQSRTSDAVILLPPTIESRKIIEAFLRWSEIGGKSWNFPGSTDYLLRVQTWVLKIKKKIIEAILSYDGKQINYFAYATAAEFYRLILNGYCQKYEKASNLNVGVLLHKNSNITETDNGHCKSWNDLLRIVNSNDGNMARECVFEFYNLPQGAGTSKNYEFDYMEFDKAVKKVINKGFVYKEEELQLDDPVKKRKLYSEYLKKILDRIEKVVEDEKREINICLSELAKNIDLDDLESADDIDDVLSEINNFYKQARKSHVPASIHYNITAYNHCKKDSSSIFSAVRTLEQIQKIDNPVDCLLKMSKDPLGKLQEFTELVRQASVDVVLSNNYADERFKSRVGADTENEIEEYVDEKEIINQCKTILEEVKANYVIR